MHTSQSFSIAIDARFFRSSTSGIGRYTQKLLENLAAIDTVNQYTVYITPEDFPEWHITQENFTVKVVPISHYTLAEQTTFWKLLQKGKYDLVHFLNYNHPILYRRPFLTTLHDLTVYFFPVGRSQKSIIRRQLFLHVLRRSLKAAKKVIAISEYTAKDAEKQLGIAHAKMEVIYHGRPDPVTPAFGGKVAVQEYLGTKSPYFLFVSQWRPHKGIITLIEAFNEFKKNTGAPHKLVLLGKQKAHVSVVQKALLASEYLDDIITPGFAPEELLPLLYRYTDGFILPSEYEGFGLTILEAFNYGAPVIVANNSSIPEVAGKAALYFPTKDVAALSEQMSRIVSEVGLADELREKGQKQLETFSWKKTAQKTLAVYMSVLEKRR